MARRRRNPFAFSAAPKPATPSTEEHLLDALTHRCSDCGRLRHPLATTCTGCDLDDLHASLARERRAAS